MMFSNFTEKARDSISCAHDIACELGHRYIGSEHLLLGLIREGSGVAAKALEAANVSEEAVKDKLASFIEPGTPLNPDTELSLTPRSKRILEFSAMEAQRFGHSYVGTEHILMAILRDGDGVGAQILVSLGVNPSTLYNMLSQDVSSESGSSSAGKAKKLLTSSAEILPSLREKTNLIRLSDVIRKLKELSRFCQEEQKTILVL